MDMISVLENPPWGETWQACLGAYVWNWMIKVFSWLTRYWKSLFQKIREIISPLRQGSPFFLEKSINEVEEMLDWDQRPQITQLQYAVLDYD